MAPQAHDKSEQDRREMERQQPIRPDQGGRDVVRQQDRPPQDMQQERERMARERQENARQDFAVREKDNNPATAVRRQYDQVDQPGLHPANQPDPDTKLNKATRLDLEDLTGNPGHRNVNPDAPANSINKPTDPKTGRLESTNEPPGVEPGTSEAPSTANTIAPSPRPYGVADADTHNEPRGSDVLAGATYEAAGADNKGNLANPRQGSTTQADDMPKDDDKEDEREELPSPAELERMTRADLDELAEERGVDISDAGNKQDVIDALRKDARKRKRA